MEPGHRGVGLTLLAFPQLAAYEADVELERMRREAGSDRPVGPADRPWLADRSGNALGFGPAESTASDSTGFPPVIGRATGRSRR